MPSEMFERGKHDAEADALDENYYQYYYDYRLGYDEVRRNRRRSRRQIRLRRMGRALLRIMPVVLLLCAAAAGGYRYFMPTAPSSAALAATPTRTPRPTLVPPTPRPSTTPTPELALRPEGFAVITGTNGVALLARAGPGTDKKVVARFPEGKVVKLLEGPTEATGHVWWHIELENQEGWSSAAYLRPVPSQP